MKRDAAAVFIVALVVRLLFVWLAPPPAPDSSDQWDYDRLAHAMLDGRGYVGLAGTPTSERPPLYALMLAAIYPIDDSPRAVHVVQAVIDAVTCLLVYLLAARHFGPAVARVAAVLAVTSLSLLFSTLFLMTETVSTLFMVASILVLDVALDGWRRGALFATGVLVGLSALTKGTTLLLPLALLVPIWVAARQDWRRFVQAGALLFAGFGLTLLPWTIRNYQVHGELIPLVTQTGWVMYSSYVPPDGKIFGNYTVDDTVLASRALSEVDASRYLLGAAIAHVRENPGDLPRLTALKLLFFVSPFDWGFLAPDVSFNFTYALTALLAVYGAWTMSWRGWRPVLLVTAPVFFLLQSLGIYGSARLRIPIEPLLMILAAAGWMTAWQRTQHQRRAFVAASATAVVLAFGAYWFGEDVKDASAAVLRQAGLW